MIYLRWSCLTLIDYLLLVPFCLAVPFVSALTFPASMFRNGLLKRLFCTYDQDWEGDRGWRTKRCFFPNVTTGLKGYLNRCGWLWRNPNYPFQRWAAVEYAPHYLVTWKGDAEISDKYARSGYYFALALSGTQAVAFEFYAVIPWGKKCTRIRLGWKIMTDKFESLGYAPMVNTITPVKGYGESLRAK